ncbi:hypothetical protein [Flavobacterium subsaxonicum]|uniref:Uncharacterized protein n=1 Tax=Flavobacterium subsaxonicum WB 4.1-42 = DSM 21790 TaxID=1121898 RepID=A0A0A2MHC5_9FLAO|nr:hypothetical protein [Flavobacterium subsaxonicum]KGO91026.1 hypothetical protein Q766_20280 [Flavobacterium subsaxonicum WB 4.1-42 = DSM 21790]
MSDKYKSLSEPDFFWKNFRLGTELQISGTLIYNALYFLDTIEYIHHEEDIFELLYNLAIGIERLQKITIILLEHSESINQLDFEKSLITHNHLILHEIINKIQSIKLGKVHFKFLSLLRDFYTSYRYERFNKKSINKPNFDKKAFQEFLVNELQLETSKDDEALYPYKKEEWIENNKRLKKFIGKTIGTIVNSLYEIIGDRARKLGTYTYDIRYGSKAFKIFMAKEFTFEIENNFKKEIIVSLLSKEGMNDEFKKYIQTLEPINLDEYNSSYYIQYLMNSITNYSRISEYQYLIEEKEIPKDRINDIEHIGTGQYFDFDFEDDEISK